MVMEEVESEAMVLQSTSFFLSSKYSDASQCYLEKHELAKN